jgi:crotonobetainyl-CoA:carnitine CoA-transferase CaiB-like acyl-CoA transferase
MILVDLGAEVLKLSHPALGMIVAHLALYKGGEHIFHEPEPKQKGLTPNLRHQEGSRFESNFIMRRLLELRPGP